MSTASASLLIRSATSGIAGVEQRALLVARPGRRPARPAAGTGITRSVISSTESSRMWARVDRLGLLQVEAGRVGVDVADLERLDHLVDA